MAKLTAELRDLPDDELFARVEQSKEELFNLRFQLATGQLDNPARIKQLRHDVARTLTVLRERHLEAEVLRGLERADTEALERSREAQRSGQVQGTALGDMEKEALEERDEPDETDEEDEA